MNKLKWEVRNGGSRNLRMHRGATLAEALAIASK